MKGLIIKKLANRFWVKLNNGLTKDFIARKNLKSKNLFVGDQVEVNLLENVIDNLIQRKNELVRPPLANIDQMLIMLSSVPKPDFLVIDKLILYCKTKNIKPIIVINKSDLIKDKNFIENIKFEYKEETIINISCKDNTNIEQILNLLDNKITAIAGQSAVGKSSLIKRLTGNNNIEIGELSKKIERGKNTTRHCELFEINNGYIADTPGFTFFDEDLLEIKSNDLKNYYNFFSNNCKFSSCAHINEDEKFCYIKKLLKDNKISYERYNRYVKIYLELKEREGKYGK